MCSVRLNGVWLKSKRNDRVVEDLDGRYESLRL